MIAAAEVPPAAPPASQGVPSVGVRSWLATASAVVRSDATLWLFGALSFSVRGGIAALLLPIVWVPTPVILSIYLAPYLTTSGLSPSIDPVLAVGGLLAVALLLAAVILAAVVDLAAFARVASHPETARLRTGREPRVLVGSPKWATLLQLVTLNLLALVPLAAVVVPFASDVNAAAVSELQSPTVLDTPFVVTVLGRVSVGLALVVGVILAVDLLLVLASRELLVSRAGLRHGETANGVLSAVAMGVERLVHHPVRTLFVWAVAWTVTVAAILVIGTALMLSWSLVRQALLVPDGDAVANPASTALRQFMAVVLFAATWVGGITLCGIASSLRGALWTINALD